MLPRDAFSTSSPGEETFREVANDSLVLLLFIICRILSMEIEAADSCLVVTLSCGPTLVEHLNALCISPLASASHCILDRMLCISDVEDSESNKRG